MHSLNTYSLSAKTQITADVKVYVEAIASKLVSSANVLGTLEESLRVATLAGAKIGFKLGEAKPAIFVSDTVYAKSIAGYNDAERKVLWEYKRINMRVVLLSTLVNSDLYKKKFNFRVKRSIEGIVKSMLNAGTNKITLSQVVNIASKQVGVKEFYTKDGEVHQSNAWINDELAAQFVSELAEMDIFDLHVDGKIHMVAMSKVSISKLDVEEFRKVSSKAKFLKLKTILTEPATAVDVRMSQSSWWYETPEHSDDMNKYLEIQANVKYVFDDDAEEKIEELFKAYHKVSELKDWQQERVAEFKNQIRASHANGGHYIAGLLDSATRYYYAAEIGHFQTSSALRSMVSIDGISDPVKYDFRNNVVQMYTLLTGIKGLGKYVGLTADEEQLGDLREMLAARLNEAYEVTSFNKDNTKPLFMIWAYNAGKQRILDGTFKDEICFFTGKVTRIPDAMGLKAISGITDEDDYLFSIFEEILIELIPGVVAIKMLFRKLLKDNPVTEVEWEAPDGSICKYASAVTVVQGVNWYSSKYRKHTHTHYRKEIEEGTKNTGILPRWIQSYDAYVQRQLIIRAHALGITVVPNHDSFIFDRCYISTINMIVDEIFEEILMSDGAQKFVTNFNKAKVDVTLKQVDGSAVTTSSFGDRLTVADIKAGTPLAIEEM